MQVLLGQAQKGEVVIDVLDDIEKKCRVVGSIGAAAHRGDAVIADRPEVRVGVGDVERVDVAQAEVIGKSLG